MDIYYSGSLDFGGESNFIISVVIEQLTRDIKGSNSVLS